MTKKNEVGYQNPPVSTRFERGRSGNPNGRPPDRHRRPPYDAVLGQMVIVREDGHERRVTAAEAFLLQLVTQGLNGDAAAMRLALPHIEKARAARLGPAGVGEITFAVRTVRPGSVNSALLALRMGTKVDRYRPSAQILLEPWIVEEALERLGGRRLSHDEQVQVVRVTRTPHKVRWPDWWKVLLGDH